MVTFSSTSKNVSSHFPSGNISKASVRRITGSVGEQICFDALSILNSRRFLNLAFEKL